MFCKKIVTNMLKVHACDIQKDFHRKNNKLTTNQFIYDDDDDDDEISVPFSVIIVVLIDCSNNFW